MTLIIYSMNELLMGIYITKWFIRSIFSLLKVFREHFLSTDRLALERPILLLGSSFNKMREKNN